jgi:hypothetical protein
MPRSALLGAVTLAMLALPGAATAQPTSHVLQNPQDHVLLLVDPTTPGMSGITCTSRRILPTTDPADRLEPFAIPTGRLLVITDVEWEAVAIEFFDPHTPFQFAPGSVVVFELDLARFSPFTTLPLMRSRALTVGPGGDPVAGSEQLTTGIVVAPGTVLCAHAEVEEAGGNPPVQVTRTPARLGRVLLRGYLIDAN